MSSNYKESLFEQGKFIGRSFYQKSSFLCQINNLETSFDSWSSHGFDINAIKEVHLADEVVALIEGTMPDRTITKIFWRNVLKSEFDKRWMENAFIWGFFLATIEFVNKIREA